MPNQDLARRLREPNTRHEFGYHDYDDLRIRGVAVATVDDVGDGGGDDDGMGGGEAELLFPNDDGTWPTPEEGKLLVTNEGVFYYKASNVKTADPGVTWTSTIPTSLDILGVYHYTNRPEANLANVGKYIYVTNIPGWQQCRATTSYYSGTIYSWQGGLNPTGWIGTYADEEEAENHVTANNQLAYYSHALYYVTAYTDSAHEVEASWERTGIGISTIHSTTLTAFDTSDDAGLVDVANSTDYADTILSRSQVVAYGTIDRRRYRHLSVPADRTITSIIGSLGQELTSWTLTTSATAKLYTIGPLNAQSRRAESVVVIVE